MGLYIIPNFFSGDAKASLTRNVPGSGIGGERGSLGSFFAAVNWFLSTYAKPHALELAQDTFCRAALVNKEGVNAFAAHLRSLAKLRGNILFEGTIMQQRIQGPTVYVRANAVSYNKEQRSYQQLLTYVARNYRAAKDVMALSYRGCHGGSLWKGQTSRGPRGLSVNLNSPWKKDDIATHDMVTVLPSGTTGLRTAGATPYPRQEAPTAPSLGYMCLTRGHRVSDSETLTEKKRDIVKPRGAPASDRRARERAPPRIEPPSSPFLGTTCWEARKRQTQEHKTPHPRQPRPCWNARIQFHRRFADGCWSVTPTALQMGRYFRHIWI